MYNVCTLFLFQQILLEPTHPYCMQANVPIIHTCTYVIVAKILIACYLLLYPQVINTYTATCIMANAFSTVEFLSD